MSGRNFVIPYNVLDNPAAKKEAIHTGNCICTQSHGSRLPPFHPSGMQILFLENGDVVWEDWVEELRKQEP